MPMSAEQFEALIASLEQLAKRDPAAYRVRVAALALLGYAYIFAVLGLAVGLLLAAAIVIVQARSAFVLIFKLAVPLALLAFFICRSFWVRFSPPTGVQISAEDSPEIFKLIDELTGKLDCPRIDAVYLNADFNAALYSMPRFGFLGSHKHYLCLGLPLMQALPPEQFRAVLAHEMGHLSGNHGKFGSWIYSVRTTSAQLLDVVRKQSALGSFVFKRFFEWYYPLFNAYSFVLIRQHEYEADRCAVEISGAKVAALSLISSEIKNRYVDLKFWKELFKSVDESPAPPPAPFHDLSELMLKAKMDDDAFKWYQQALRRQTGINETHPALSDRIKAMAGLQGAETFDTFSEDELRKAWEVKRSAAQEYFQNKLPEFEQRMDLAWHHAYDGNWRILHGERAETRKQLDLLLAQDSNNLSEVELLQLCQLFVQIKPASEAIPVLKKALEKLPDNVSVNYSLGECLLQEGDFSGIAYLEKAMLLKPVYGHELCELIYKHLSAEGNEEQARVYLKRTQAYKAQLQQAARERAGLRSDDKFIAHSLQPQQVEAITNQFKGNKFIKRAFLVCKEVSILADRPFFVVVVEIKYPWYSLVSADTSKQVIRTLSKAISMPSEGYVIAMKWSPPNLKKAIKNIPNALIYERTK